MADNTEKDTPVDCLGHSELARALAQICDTTELPASILVYGAWGTGKTTFLKHLENHLKLRESMNTGMNYHVVSFNPWEYETSPNLLLPLLKTISVSLPMDTRKEVLKLSLACLRSAIDVGVRAGSKLISAGLFQMKLNDFADALKAEEADLDSIKDEVAECRDKFFDLTKLMAKRTGKRALVVLLDDLDRCTPDNVVSLIEGIKLYLAQKIGTPVIFVWAMDRDVVSSAITSKYDNPVFNGADYLEKLFEYQTPVPRLDSGSFRKMTTELVGNCRDKKGLNMLLGQDPINKIARFLNIAPLRNPRTLRRIWNMLEVLALDAAHIIEYARREGLAVKEGRFDGDDFANNLMHCLIIAYRFRDWRFNVLHHRDKWSYFLDICHNEVPEAQKEMQRLHNLAVVLARKFEDVELNIEKGPHKSEMKLNIQEKHLKTMLTFSKLIERHAF